MERMKLKAELRDERGTRGAKRLRRKGVVPAVLYGEGPESMAIGVDTKDLSKVLRGKGGEHAIIDLQVEKTSEGKPLKKTVIVKEVQRDHIKDIVLHVDFAAISLTEKLATKVAVVDSGEAVGVTQGGILEHILRELNIECLPADIPERILVDVSGLMIGKSIKVGDIVSPPDVKILNDANLIVFTVSVPKVEVEKVEEVPAEEAAAAGAPAEGEEKKPEEEKEGAKGKEKEGAKGKEKEQQKEKGKEK
ncbi:MAG: 50S ribosomal protein L25 [Candidatus Aureabacteria bacterium]|nr:50S ribosomal protein L25 [Candidatus Auribacterota bacterium]